MKKFFKTFERILLYYFAAMGVSLCATIVFDVPIKFVLNGADLHLALFIIGSFASIATMLLLSYFEGRRSGNLEPKYFCSALAALLAILIIVIAILGHVIYISGPTDHLARFVLYKTNPGLTNGKSMLNLYSLWFMVGAYLLLYSPTMLVGRLWGNKNRQKFFSRLKTKKDERSK